MALTRRRMLNVNKTPNFLCTSVAIREELHFTLTENKILHLCQHYKTSTEGNSHNQEKQNNTFGSRRGYRGALVAEMSQLASLKAISRAAAHTSTDGGGGCARARKSNTSWRACVWSPVNVRHHHSCDVYDG